MKLPSSFPRLKGFRFPREIVAYAVWVYHRFALSAADVEDLLAERGVIVSRETVRLWINRFGRHFPDGDGASELIGQLHLVELLLDGLAQLQTIDIAQDGVGTRAVRKTCCNCSAGGTRDQKDLLGLSTLLGHGTAVAVTVADR